ncbi:MAG: leucine-rich repeat domain-containing protein, partial [Verrucomicrobiota bacterium]
MISFQTTIIAVAAWATSCSLLTAQTSGTFESLNYSSDGTEVTITSMADYPSRVVVPSHILGLPVTTIGEFAFNRYGDRLETVILPDTVRAIGRFAFSGCTSLSSIDFPDNLETIDEEAFRHCTSLTSVALPNNLETIGSGAFRHCTSLTSVVLPNDLETISSGMFSDCTSLTNVVLPAKLKITGTFSFFSCTSLKSINFPESLETIGSGTFESCTSLTDVNLPDGLITIDDSAFKRCSSLVEVRIPNSIKHLSSSVFFECLALRTVFLPEEIETLGAFVFSGCVELKAIVFPSSLSSIGDHSFSDTGLTQLTVPNTVVMIGDNAFLDCKDLTGVSLPERFLSSIARIGLDSNPSVATNYLIDGVSKSLSESPVFLEMLAQTIESQDGDNYHFGIATQSDLDVLADSVPGAVRAMFESFQAETAITGGLEHVETTLRGVVEFQLTTNFDATAFHITGLPPGLKLDRDTGQVSGRCLRTGTFHLFIHAGIPGSGTSANGVKTIEVESPWASR